MSTYRVREHNTEAVGTGFTAVSPYFWCCSTTRRRPIFSSKSTPRRQARKKTIGQRVAVNRVFQHPTRLSDRIHTYLSEVGGLASLVLGDLVHRVLGAPLGLAVGPPLFGDVHHLSYHSMPVSINQPQTREGGICRRARQASKAEQKMSVCTKRFA